MPKPEWGSKRICHSCGARYYDLSRSPIICPKCGTEFDPEAFLRSRRSRTIVPEEPAPKAAPAKKATEPEAEPEEPEAEAESEDLADEPDAVEAVDLESDDVATEAKTEGDDFSDGSEVEEKAAKVLHEDASELADEDLDNVVEVDPKSSEGT